MIPPPMVELLLLDQNWVITFDLGKGQLILKLKQILKFSFEPKATEIFLNFCPSFKKPLKSDRNKR